MSDRPIFTVDGFEPVNDTTAIVTLCGPLAEVQRLCPIGAEVELRKFPPAPMRDIHVDIVRRRMVIPLPCSVSDLSSPKLIALTKTVCGKDAVVDARVSERLGAMAVCARGDGDAWLAEVSGG